MEQERPVAAALNCAWKLYVVPAEAGYPMTEPGWFWAWIAAAPVDLMPMAGRPS